jgi:Dna[CI] antecedent, DciA
MRKTNEQTLKDVMQALFKAYGLDTRLAEKRIINAWPNICGPMIAKYTTNIYISHKKLFLHIDNAVVREEIIFARESLIKKLNAEAGLELLNEIIVR